MAVSQSVGYTEEGGPCSMETCQPTFVLLQRDAMSAMIGAEGGGPARKKTTPFSHGNKVPGRTELGCINHTYLGWAEQSRADCRGMEPPFVFGAITHTWVLEGFIYMWVESFTITKTMKKIRNSYSANSSLGGLRMTVNEFNHLKVGCIMKA